MMVASSEFVQAAQHQASALGMEAIAADAVFVPHPIQDATDGEMHDRAQKAVDAILRALTSPK